MNCKFFFVTLAVATSFVACAQKQKKLITEPIAPPINLEPNAGEAVATFAAGCFWCVEEVYESLAGVREVISGYAGGKAEDANYDAVSSGRTEHAETVQIYYVPAEISFEEITAAFFASHDPTTMNRQGPDAGPQYRSIAFYRNEAEKEIILNEIKKVNESGEYKSPVVTQVLPFTAFYPAETYHQDYVEQNPDNPYVKSVSIPRYEKFRKQFKGKYKE